MAHSHGGGIGSLEDPNSGQGDMEGYERTKEIVERLQTSADIACSATDDRDEKLALLNTCLKELLLTVDERELF